MKNPLAAVRLQVQWLARMAGRSALEYECLQQGLAVIDNASARMEAQLAELQDVVRLRSGHPLEIRAERVDLVTLATEAVADARAAAVHEIVVDTALPEVVGVWDPRWLRRVLDNLLGNAIKYSPDGGRITVLVSTERRNDRACAVLTVRDVGVGIPAADQPFIFERYRRGSNVRARTHGTGIGLAGVRQIVVQHGGTVTVDSEEGSGSMFTVRLPLERDPNTLP